MVKITNPHTGKSFEFTFGADPELFVLKDKKLVSAYGLIKGDKKNPLKVKDGAVQVDGMALEFNIDPATDFNKFNANMDSVLDTLQRMVPGYEFMIQPVAEFGAAYINSQPKEAKELGCEPDFNAYTKAVNPRPQGDTPFRTASGHLHIGWTKDVNPHDPTHFEACCALVKNLDTYVGIPSMIWDEQLSGGTADKRRALYGRAGAFRPKPYGLEYRVLSNIWITDRVLRKTVFENSIEAVKKTFENWEQAGAQKFSVDEEVPVKDVNGREVSSLTAEQIVNKHPGWKSATVYALEYGGIRPSYFYRQAEKKAA
jgi:Phage phiEco32-like COOH.NH2 ligase-type 2